MMRAALGVREAHAPLAGRRDAVGLVGVGRHLRWTRPRSAVTVSSTAPGLAPLTGFSRSRCRSRYSLRSECRPNRRYARVSCRGLEACDTVSHEARSTALHSAPVSVLGGRGLFMFAVPGTLA